MKTDDAQVKPATPEKSEPQVHSSAWLGALVEFTKAKLADAEKSLKARAEMRRVGDGSNQRNMAGIGSGTATSTTSTSSKYSKTRTDSTAFGSVKA